METTFHFSCPTCGKRLKGASGQIGKKARCSCGQVFVVPGRHDAYPLADPGLLGAAPVRRSSQVFKSLFRYALFGQLAIVTAVALLAFFAV